MTPDNLAEIEAAAEKAVMALVWSPETKPNDYCSYNHTFADTPFGRYQIEWKAWKEHPSFSIDFGNESVQCWASDVPGARKIAEAHYTKTILSALNLDALVTELQQHRADPAQKATAPVTEEQVEAAARELASRAFARVSTAGKARAAEVVSRGWIIYADDARAALEAAALASPAPAATVPEGWKPIETAPKDGTRVLATCADGVKRIRAMLASAPAPHPLAKHMPSRDMLRNKIASDPDDEGIGVAPAPDTKQEPVAWLVHDHSELGDYLTKSREAAVNSGLPFTSLFPSPVTQKVSEATHRHVKRGTEYVLIGYGKMQAENWRALDRPLDDPNQLTGVDYREVAIYRSVDDGSLWVRPREEFEDGRFVPLQAQEKSE